MTLKKFLSEMDSPLLEYVRDENNQKIGVMVAFKSKQGKIIHFGWSKCKVKGALGEVDTFNRDRGVHIAVRRAKKYFNTDSLNINVYFRMRKQFIKFMAKCKRFYTKNGSTYEFPSFFTENINNANVWGE